MRCAISVLVIVAVLLAGCNGPTDRSAPELGLTIDRVRAATTDLADRTIRLEKNLVAARGISVEVCDALRTSAAERRAALPLSVPLANLCDHLDAQAVRIDKALLPKIDESLKEGEAIQATVAVLDGPVMDELLSAEGQVAALAKERDALEKDRDSWKERATSAIRKWLTAIAIGAFAFALGSIAVAVYVSRKWGIVVGLVSLGVFATAAALSRWYEYFEWAGLGILLAAFGVLGYLAWRYRKSFVQVVQGGQDWKAVVAGLAKKSRRELLELFKDSDVLRKLFNKTQGKAQDKATQAMVGKTKKANGNE